MPAGRSPPRADALARHAEDRLGARRAQLKRALDSDRVQKRAVVTDDEQSAVIGGEAGFDGGQGLAVEMVAGLVEGQQLWRLRGAGDAGEAGAEHLGAAPCP